MKHLFRNLMRTPPPQTISLGDNAVYINNSDVRSKNSGNHSGEHASDGNEDSNHQKKEKHHIKSTAIVMICVLVLVIVALSLTLACLKVDPNGFSAFWLTLQSIFSKI